MAAASGVEKVVKIPRGKPKSGRFWKSDGAKYVAMFKVISFLYKNIQTNKRKTKFFIICFCRKSDMINVPSLHSSWEKKIQKKNDERNVKRLENDLKEAAKKQREVCTQLFLSKFSRKNGNKL